MAKQAGPMREALKRKMSDLNNPAQLQEEDANAIVEPEVVTAGPEGIRENVGGPEEALAGLDACIEKLPPEQADEARQLVDRLRDLFKNYEKAEPEEEIKPSETGKGPSTGNSPLGEY